MVLWVRGRIGIKGNEAANKKAEFHSLLGSIRNDPGTRPWKAPDNGLEIRKSGEDPTRIRRHQSQLEQTRTLSIHMAQDRSGTPEIVAPQNRQDGLSSLLLRPPEGGLTSRHFPLYLQERKTWEELDKQVWMERKTTCSRPRRDSSRFYTAHSDSSIHVSFGEASRSGPSRRTQFTRLSYSFSSRSPGKVGKE